jgi:hypothetical protein
MKRKISSGVLGPVKSSTNTNIVFDENKLVSNKDDLNFLTQGVGSVTTSKSLNIQGDLDAAGGIGIAGELNIGEEFNIQGTGINNTTLGSNTPAAGGFTFLSSSGLSTINSLTQAIGTKTGATGVVVHDFTEADTWYHTSIAANFTVNITNLPAINDTSYVIKLILIQGATARLSNALQIDGATQTIRWGGYTAPNVSSNKTELVTFTVIRNNNAWTVYGSLTSFGQTLDGSTEILAAPSAAWIKNANPAAANGVYWIDHGTGPYQAYCFMDAGGHILVGKIASTTSSASPWLYNGANWGATTAQNEAGTQNLTSADALNRGYYSYTIQSNIRFCLGTQTNALTVTLSGNNARAFFTGSQINLNPQLTRSQMLTWFQTGTGVSPANFDNQPNCNRIGINRADSAQQAMRFGITMNNENDCNSNDSSIGFGTFTNNQPTGPRAIPAGGHRWNPDAQYPAVGYIFVQ